MSLISTLVIILASLALFIRDEFFSDKRTISNRRASRAAYVLMELSCAALLFKWHSERHTSKEIHHEIVDTHAAVLNGFRVTDEGISCLSSNITVQAPIRLGIYVNGLAITNTSSNLVHSSAGDRLIENATILLPNQTETKTVSITVRNLGHDLLSEAKIIARFMDDPSFSFAPGWQPTALYTETETGIQEENKAKAGVWKQTEPVNPSGYFDAPPIFINAPTSFGIATIYIDVSGLHAEHKRMNLVLTFDPQAQRITQPSW